MFVISEQKTYVTGEDDDGRENVAKKNQFTSF